MTNKSLYLMGIFFFASCFAHAKQAKHAKERGWEELDATYEVPAPAELAPYAHFPHLSVKRRVRGERIEMEYQLPKELTGRAVQVEMRDVDGLGQRFTGPLGEMTCDGKDCTLRYPGLELDAREVRDYLAARGTPTEELAARMQIFARFDNGNPAGVIHFSR